MKTITVDIGKGVCAQKGFILVEVLIAAVVMAFGLLALAQLQVIATKMNAQNRSVTEATLLAMGQLEHLKNLPFDAPSDYPAARKYPLDDDGNGEDLKEISGDPDHVHPGYPIDADGYPMNSRKTRFGLFWNVADNTPADSAGGAKTVAVTVTWFSGPKNLRKHVTIPTVVRRES